MQNYVMVLMFIHYSITVLIFLRDTMNKRFLPLFLLLAFIPACRRQARVVSPENTTYVPGQTYEVQTQILPTIPEDEDIPEFELEESENPFNNVPAMNENQEERLDSVDSVNARHGVDKDHYTESAKYGFKRVYYPYNVHDIKPDQKATLEHNIAIAQSLENKGYKIILEGHACNSAGSKNYNLHLSEKRAEEVRKHLANNGVKNVDTIGWGSENLIVPSGTAEQQSPNRRVEFYAYAHNKLESNNSKHA